MKNMFKLSAVAALAIAAVTSFTGCGSDSSTSKAVASTITVADGYGINGATMTLDCAGTISTHTADFGANGAFTFTPAAGTTLSNCEYSFPASTKIDLNNDGVDNDGNATIGFEMKATGDATVVSQLTTMVVAILDDNATADVTALKALVNTFNPVTAATTVAAGGTTGAAAEKLMVMAEVVKTVLSNTTADNGTAALVDMNTTSLTTAGDVNATAILATTTVGATLTTLVENKVEVINQIIDILPSLDTTKVNVDTLVVAVSDADSNVTAAITASVVAGETNTTLANLINSDANITDVNTSVTTANTAVTTAETAADNVAAVLTLGNTVTLGSKSVTITDGSFSTTLAKDSNISDFYTVTLNSASVNKGFTAQLVNVEVNVTNTLDSNDYVSLNLTNVGLSSDDNSTVSTTFVGGMTGISLTSGLSGVTNGSGTIATTVTNTDLSFNVGTIITNTGSSAVATTISQLDTYFATAKNYTATITVSDLNTSELTTEDTTITGTISVQ